MSDHAFESASAVVIFCRGPHCPQEAIAEELQRNGIAVVRLPQADDAFRLDADHEAQRILEVARSVPPGIPIGFAGGAVAGAGALIAAAQRPDLAAVVVAINARTDLAVDSLRSVRAPVLFLVNDMPVLRMNREALTAIKGEKRLEIVHGTDDEVLDHIVRKSTRWLVDRLLGVGVA